MRIVWREVFRVITNGWFTVGGHRCWVDEILKKTMLSIYRACPVGFIAGLGVLLLLLLLFTLAVPLFSALFVRRWSVLAGASEWHRACLVPACGGGSCAAAERTAAVVVPCGVPCRSCHCRSRCAPS